MKHAADADSEVIERRISICFVIASIVTDRAGTEGHLLRLIRSLDREIFRPVLVVLQRSEWTDSFSDPSIPLIVLDFQSFMRPLSWRSVAKLARLLHQYQVRIVETHFPEAHFVGAIAAKIAGVPVVIGNRRDLVSQYSKKDLTLCRLSNRFTSLHLANSRVVAEVASRIEGIPRVEVIYNGIDFDALTAEPTCQLVPPLNGGPIVSIVANLTPVKNIRMFVEAAARVASNFKDVRFAVIGCGPEESPLKSYAASRSIHDRVLWTGRVNDIRPYLRKSIIGCLTSTSEGMSNSVLEYMAARLPVVATRVGGIPEAVVEGVTGCLVESGNVDDFAVHLHNLLSDPVKRTAMGQAGHRRARELFSLSTQVEAYEKLYQSLIKHTRPIRSEIESAK